VSRRYFDGAASAVFVALVVGLAGCGTQPGGDPGGRRLRELSRDSVFAAPAPRATTLRVTRTSARYVHPAFQGAGWDGPSVVVAFTSPASPADVFRFYAARAAAAGWKATRKDWRGLTDGWTKTYPDGARATLSLFQLDRVRPTGRHRYSLAGGVAAAAG
jgi:hypothetical protein